MILINKQWPQQNKKSCRTDDYEFSPAVYRDLSCCTEVGINSINGYYAMFDADSFSDSTSGGNCRAYNEMMELMICDPDQGSYVKPENVSEEGEIVLRVCLSTCQKWFDACGLPGVNLSEYFTYTDAQSMCEELWQGYGGDYCSPVYFQRSENFACKMKLSIQVVESSCLSMQEPSEELIAYYEAMQNGSLIAEYPNDCNSERKSLKDTWILIGILSGSVLDCCFLSGALFALTRLLYKSNVVAATARTVIHQLSILSQRTPSFKILSTSTAMTEILLRMKAVACTHSEIFYPFLCLHPDIFKKTLSLCLYQCNSRRSIHQLLLGNSWTMMLECERQCISLNSH